MSKEKLLNFLKSKTLKKIIIIAVAVIAIGGIVTGSYFGAQRIKLNKAVDNVSTPEISGDAKNTVLMIGDGMGPNHIEVTEAYYGIDAMNMVKLARADGLVHTFSHNDWVTDSAAAATALSCGVKTNNYSVATYKGANLTNMSEYASSLGKRVGIIATETLTGATPAGFSAHSKDRDNTDEIALCQLESSVDIFMGAGKEYFDGKTDIMTDNKLTYFTSFAALTTAVSYEDGVASVDVGRIITCYDEITTNSTGTDDSPTLAEMSVLALAYLDFISGDDGFFLMIEGSHIDKRSHSNDLKGMVAQLKAFDEAVAAVVNWANADGDTFVMVTADHETGGLAYDGETGDDLSDKLFTRGSHSGVDVRYFVYGKVPAELTETKTIDNTNVAHIIRALMDNYAEGKQKAAA